MNEEKLEKVLEELKKIVDLIRIVLESENKQILKIKKFIEKKLPEDYPECNLSRTPQYAKGYYKALFDIKLKLKE